MNWVDEAYSIHEGPLGLFKVPITDAGTLTAEMFWFVVYYHWVNAGARLMTVHQICLED